MSEQVLNGASAQLGYTMTFTSKYAGKYRTGDKLRIQTIHKLNATQNKNKQQKIQQNKTTPVPSPFTTQARKQEMGLFYCRGPVRKN